jgi:hypothetical protein
VGEHKRLTNESYAGLNSLSKDEIWKRVREMPESLETNRLVNLQRPRMDLIDKLTLEMWPIPAQTAEGRRAKALVLLGTIMGSEWTGTDEETDWEKRMARNLLIELVGGEPDEQLRDQFA